MPNLLISPTPSGWQVTDTAGRLPASTYDLIETAKAEARAYLASHGGGDLTVSEGDIEVAAEQVPPEPYRHHMSEPA